MHAVIQCVRCWMRYETRQAGICERPPPVGSVISRPGLLYAGAKREAGVSPVRSARPGARASIVAPAILCSVEQISNGTTCIFPSGCPKSQTAEGHLWKRRLPPLGGADLRFAVWSGLVWLVTLHLYCQNRCPNVTFEGMNKTGVTFSQEN